MALGAGLNHLAICSTSGIILAAGFVSDMIYFQYSDDGGASTHAFNDDSTSKAIASAVNEQPAIAVLGTSEIIVSLTYDSTIRTYVSRDFGETWLYVDSL